MSQHMPSRNRLEAGVIDTVLLENPPCGACQSRVRERSTESKSATRMPAKPKSDFSTHPPRQTQSLGYLNVGI